MAFIGESSHDIFIYFLWGGIIRPMSKVQVFLSLGRIRASLSASLDRLAATIGLTNVLNVDHSVYVWKMETRLPGCCSLLIELFVYYYH